MSQAIFLVLIGVLAWSPAFAQEPQLGDKREERPAPSKKDAVPAKAETKKCCEGMDKSEMKDEMKAKSEKMKSMKEKMGEKAKAKTADGSKSKAEAGAGKIVEPKQETHAH